MNFENNQNSLLTFRVGPVLCCAPSLPVRSIITPPKLTRPPGSDRAQPGIFQHGSTIVKVIDLRQKFGIAKTEQTDPGNLIICIISENAYAFWVDHIIDVFDFPTAGWGTLPPAIPRDIFTRTLLLKEKIHLYSEFEKLLNIEGLDYLKHYIQQLTNEGKDEIKPTTENTKSSTDALNPEVINQATKSLNTKNQDDINQENINIRDKNLQFDQNKLRNETKSSQALELNTSVVKSEIIHSKNPELIVSKTSESESKQKRFSSAKSDSTSNETKNISNSVANYSNSTVKKSSATNKPNDKPLLETRLNENKTTNTTYTSSSENNDESSSIAGFILFALIFLLATGFIIYLFLSSTSGIPTTPLNDIVNEPVNETALDNFTTHHNVSDNKIVPQTIVDINITATDSATERLNSTSATIDDTQLTQEELKPEKDTVIQTQDEIPHYRADILKADNEITITIHSPVKVEKDSDTETLSVLPFSEQQAGMSEQAEIDEKINNDIPVQAKTTELDTQSIVQQGLPDQKTQEKIKPTTAKETIPAKQIIREVIHTVQKGDTLWAIAKKYVNDPFLYPELARLSNIKNPHRIYPGNRVRIRFINNQ